MRTPSPVPQHAFAYKVDRWLSSALGEAASSHRPGESFLTCHQCPLWGERSALPHVDLPPPASLSSSSVSWGRRCGSSGTEDHSKDSQSFDDQPPTAGQLGRHAHCLVTSIPVSQEYELRIYEILHSSTLQVTQGCLVSWSSQMRSRREKKADSFPAKPGSVSSVLAGARASLLHPSRPFTPADHSRPLFAGSDYNSRPTSAYNPVEFRQSVSKGDVFDSADFDLIRAEEDTTRPTSSHGQRSRGEAAAVAGVGAAAAGELQRGAAARGHGGHRCPEILQLPSAGAPPAPGSGSSAATVALVGELDLPGADLLALCGELWQHVTSAEFRDDQAAGLPVDKIVVDRLAKLAAEHGDDAPLLLATSRVLLQVISKRGPGLLSTCRMLFKLSKNERNDAAFHDAHIIEPLISLVIREAAQMGTDTAAAVPKGKKRAVTSFDVLVYSIGTLKNISQQSQTNQKRMSQQGVFAAMAEVLSSAVREQLDTVRVDPQRPRYTDRQAQVLVQATATLRNMAVISAHRKQFVTFEIVDKLCRLASSDGAVYHLELMLNVSRILSKLTLHEDCRAPMYNRSTIQSFVSLLEAHPTNLSLVLRVSFILGNLTTTSDDCRVLILETAGAVELLLDMLQQLCERSCGAGAPEDGSFQPQSQAVVTAGAAAEPEPELPQTESDINATRQSQTDETLVKLIRLLANLAINGEVGLMVSQDRRCMLLVTVVESKPIADHEELVLNAVSAITNLSFYHQALNAVLQHERVATLLVPLLLHDNHEAKLECARCALFCC
jgi:hypothetical protein